MRSRARRTTAFGIALAVLLGACSNAPQEDEDIDLDPFGTLVSAQLGESQEAIASMRSRRGQEKLAECVRAAGFEYFPDPSDSAVIEAGGFDEYKERLRAEGWGYFTNVSGAQDLEVQEPTEQMKYELSLSASAQEEYQRVMHGEIDPATGEHVPGTGCFEQAYGESAESDSPEARFADLLEEIQNAFELAEEEPEVRKARDAYRECLSRAGFPGVHRDAAELLEQRFTEEFPDGDYATNDPRIPELAKFEVSLANAHLDCLEETDVDTVASRARARVEAQILERRAKDVEAYIQAMREYYELD